MCHCLKSSERGICAFPLFFEQWHGVFVLPTVVSIGHFGIFCVMKPSPRKTRRAWNTPGDAHFITYSCLNRWPLLTRKQSRLWVISAMELVRIEFNVDLWAYVIMPEHVHVLLRPRSTPYQMERILTGLKRPVSDSAKQYLRQTGDQQWLKRLSIEYPSRTLFRFWQPGGGFDQNIIHEKSVWSIVDYIHGNPVQRGLVERAEDWEWSSSRFWKGLPDPVLKMDRMR